MVFGPVGNRRFSGSGRPRGPQTPFKNMGGEAPHLWEWFLGPRGRPDPQNQRFLAGPTIMYSKPKCISLIRWTAYIKQRWGAPRAPLEDPRQPSQIPQSKGSPLTHKRVFLGRPDVPRPNNQGITFLFAQVLFGRPEVPSPNNHTFSRNE